MKKLLFGIYLAAFILPVAKADVLVLIHGYASNAATWETSGVNRVLKDNGWQRAGLPGIVPTTSKTFYALELPATAPLLKQTGLLLGFLQKLRERHAGESVTLVGHSAGGVVARLALLRGNIAQVARLITIASPHLGTPRAIQGLRAVDDKPVFCPGPGWYTMKSFFGGGQYRYLSRSRRALADMLPEDYGRLLGWANHQPHPGIRYHSIVRRQGDELVPAFSQDMNNVPALRGTAKIWSGASGHALNRQDGELVVNILLED